MEKRLPGPSDDRKRVFDRKQMKQKDFARSEAGKFGSWASSSTALTILS